MLTPTVPSPILSDHTIANLWTALVIEPALTRERLVEGCKSYLRQHRSGFDESRLPRKKYLLDAACHQFSNYDALADLVRRLKPGQGRVGRHVRKSLRRRVAAEYAHLLAPVEQQGATR